MKTNIIRLLVAIATILFSGTALAFTASELGKAPELFPVTEATVNGQDSFVITSAIYWTHYSMGQVRVASCSVGASNLELRVHYSTCAGYCMDPANDEQELHKALGPCEQLRPCEYRCVLPKAKAQAIINEIDYNGMPDEMKWNKVAKFYIAEKSENLANGVIGDGTKGDGKTGPALYLKTRLAAAESKDDDHDGVPNKYDNCTTTANYDQKNSNTNALGDACETAPGQIIGIINPLFEGNLVTPQPPTPSTDPATPQTPSDASSETGSGDDATPPSTSSELNTGASETTAAESQGPSCTLINVADMSGAGTGFLLIGLGLIVLLRRPS